MAYISLHDTGPTALGRRTVLKNDAFQLFIDVVLILTNSLQILSDIPL
jgi:hypothetical protein